MEPQKTQKTQKGFVRFVPFVVSSASFQQTKIALDVWMTREFDPGQSNAANQKLIGTQRRRSFKPYAAGGGDDVVLVYSVTADAYGSDQNSVFE